MNLILGLILATIISWLNFVIVDTFLGLPEAPGVKGAETVGYSIKNRKGDLAGGFFQGNILCSPDASAGTLIASIGVYILGIQGGLIAALLVYIGNRLCDYVQILVMLEQLALWPWHYSYSYSHSLESLQRCSFVEW